MVKLHNTNAETVITHLKSIFSRHGIPVTLVSDNGPQFTSSVFRRFVQQWAFCHRTSSPYHPQSNGKAERGVGIIKSLLNKSREAGEDIYLAILAYRRAPREHGSSPGEMLMGRKLRTQLLDNYETMGREGDERLRHQRMEQKNRYNRTARDLEELKTGDNVRLKEKYWNKKGIVDRKINPRSYQVRTEDGGTYRRNRRHIIKTREKFEPGKEELDERMNEFMDRKMEELCRQMNEPNLRDVEYKGPACNKKNDMTRAERESKTNSILNRILGEKTTSTNEEDTVTRPTSITTTPTPTAQAAPEVRRSTRVSKPVDKLNLMVNSEEGEEKTTGQKCKMDQTIMDRMRAMEERMKAKNT